MLKRQQGFTLIELVIVVAIIGILAALAIPTYQDYVLRTRVTEGLNLSSGAKTSIAEFWANNNRWPADNGEAGVASATTITGDAVQSVTVQPGGEIQVQFNQKLNNGILIMKTSAATSSGSIAWQCSAGANLDPALVPKGCL